MGQKVSPHGLRVGIIKDWDSKWYAESKDIPALIVEDNKIRNYVTKNYYNAGISRVYIDRTGDKNVAVNIFTSKPGMIVGKGGRPSNDPLRSSETDRKECSYRRL